MYRYVPHVYLVPMEMRDGFESLGTGDMNASVVCHNSGANTKMMQGKKIIFMVRPNFQKSAQTRSRKVFHNEQASDYKSGVCIIFIIMEKIHVVGL